MLLHVIRQNPGLVRQTLSRIRNQHVLTALKENGDDLATPRRIHHWLYFKTEQAREQFIPGQFICPHGACFDHAGNIFVVEWVEVGRVTKLRKVA